MRRFYSTLCLVILAGALGGCGEDQPNSPAKLEEQSPDYGQKTGDMMKTANSGLDSKNLKSGGAPSPGAMMPPMKTR